MSFVRRLAAALLAAMLCCLASAGSPPTITGLSPTEGTMYGGTAVTLAGSGFTGAMGVYFGNIRATRFTVDSDTQITAIAPAQPPGTSVMFDIVTPTGGMVHPIGYFTYVVPPELRPTVTHISPARGPASGGTTVTFTGTNLANTHQVRFGNVAAGFTVVSDTQVTATTPASPAGMVSTELTTAYGIADGSFGTFFEFIPQPTITGVSPTEGSMFGGTAVTLAGGGFTGATGVRFGNVAAASFTVDSDTQITAIAPPQPLGTSVMFEVFTPDGGGMVHPIGYFTYVVPPELRPTLTGASPARVSAAGGTQVVLTGTNLAGASSLRFGGFPAASFTVDSPTRITATTPAVASPGFVTIDVTTPYGGADSPFGFEFVAAPTLTGVAPATANAAGGTTLVLSGSGFADATAVVLGGVAARAFTVESDSRITAIAPPHATGPAAVEVSAPGGTATLASGMVFADLAVRGACGTAMGQARPTPPAGTSLCSAGLASSVASVQGEFSWTCAGQNGGADAPRCTAPWAAAGGTGSRATLDLPEAAVNNGWTLETASFQHTLPAPLPPGASTSHWPLHLRLTGGAAGSSARLTVHYSTPVPLGAVYLKHGPSPEGLQCSGTTCAQPHWYTLAPSAALFAADRRSVTLTLTDGGLGDSDDVPGQITDPGLPVLLAAPAGGGNGGGPASAVPVPALNPWAIALLALCFPALGHLRGTRQSLSKQ